MRIYLTGFMGAGKTTVGKKLARRLGCEFIDLDEYIEGREKMSVAEIFATQGENHFRELEAKYLREVSVNENVVISTGGGAPCYFENMDFMNRQGVTVYLQLTPSGLFHRLINAHDERPLVKNKSPEELFSFIQNKLSQREAYYLQASHIVNANKIKIPDLISLLNPS